jgi:type I restriction-modification system DNA methylase subunit
LDGIYNSNLFVKHACEDWEEYDDAVRDVINLLYGNDVYEYNFKEIPADILGGVYESYLGYIAQNPINEGHKKGKLFDLDDKNDIKIKSRQKRKEHGIYYTPRFIVDYIVKNALGEKLKEIGSMAELKKIKVLDPACGSGSFLTRALEEINNKYKDFGNKGNQDTKTEIVLSNIYGVDLDSQATELAKLNLLLDTLDEKAKLPSIKNVRVGNSLISGDENKLKKYFGKNWQDKKPFNWEEEFPEVFQQGGFDVIIGNPPWVTLLQDEIGEGELKYFKDHYAAAGGFKLNLFPMFVEKAVKLLKNDGVMSFIIPNRLLDTPSYKFLMKNIIDNFRINFIVDIPGGSFENVVAGNIIICIQKNKPQDIIKVYKNIFKGDDQKEVIELKTSEIKDNGYVINLGFNENLSDIFSKINKASDPLKDLANVHVGMMIKDKKEKFNLNDFEKSNKIVVGRDFDRFVKFQDRFFNPDEVEIFGGTKNKEKHKTNPKLLVRKTGNKLVAFYDDEGVFAEQSVYLVLPKNVDPKFLLTLLNSKLLTFYFRKNLITNPEAYPYIQHYDLEKIPIYKINFSNLKEKAKHDELSKQADKILELNKQLQKIPENSDRWNLIKAEIEKTDKAIDQKVYKLYGLTEDEIKIIEEK